MIWKASPSSALQGWFPLPGVKKDSWAQRVGIKAGQQLLACQKEPMLPGNGDATPWFYSGQLAMCELLAWVWLGVQLSAHRPSLVWGSGFFSHSCRGPGIGCLNILDQTVPILRFIIFMHGHLFRKCHPSLLSRISLGKTHFCLGWESTPSFSYLPEGPTASRFSLPIVLSKHQQSTPCFLDWSFRIGLESELREV